MRPPLSFPLPELAWREMPSRTATVKRRQCPRNSRDGEESRAVGFRAPQGPRDAIEWKQQKPLSPQQKDVPLCTARSPSAGQSPWLGRFCKTQTTVRIKTRKQLLKSSQEISRLSPASAGDSAVSGLCLCSACSSPISSSATKGQTRNKQASTKTPPKSSTHPAGLTSEIGGSTMVSLRNFTITNFFRAIRFFLYVSLMPWMKATENRSESPERPLRQVTETSCSNLPCTCKGNPGLHQPRRQERALLSPASLCCAHGIQPHLQAVKRGWASPACHGEGEDSPT